MTVTPAEPASEPPGAASAGRARRPPVVPIVLAAVALLALLAVVVTLVSGRGGEDSLATGGAAAVQETRPVIIEGRKLPLFEGRDDDEAHGMPAPSVRGASFDGSPTVLITPGEPTLIVFLAHWCPHCQKEVPVLQRWRAGGGGDGVRLVAVATATSAERPNHPPSAWLEGEGWSSPVLADDQDSNTARAFGLPAFPFFVVVDAGGRVVARESGELGPAELERLAAAARG